MPKIDFEKKGKAELRSDGRSENFVLTSSKFDGDYISATIYFPLGQQKA